MYILHYYIIIANAMYAKKTDFISYKDICDYKKILYKNLKEKYKYIMFDSPDECYIKVNEHTFIKLLEGIQSVDIIDDKFIDDINSIYPNEFKEIIEISRVEYLELTQKKRDNMNNMAEKIKTKAQEKELIKTSNDYIEWLTEYIKKEKELNNSDLLYNSDKIKKVDKDNCEKAILFIDTVIDYVENNNIETIETEDGYIYYVNYKGTLLEIFIGPMYYHIKLEENKKDVTLVNYEEVIKDSIKQKRKKLMYH